MKAEVLRGHLDLLLLAIVQDGPQHGYAIIEALRERSDGAIDLPDGTVYPALHRLEKAGLLTSERKQVGGRPRRTYSITASGKKAVAAKRREFTAFAQVVQRIVGAQPWPATT
jgi:DNA-binding PadR family transcriptional regulator